MKSSENKSEAELWQEERDKERFGPEHKPRLEIGGIEFQDEYFDDSPFISNVTEHKPSKEFNKMINDYVRSLKK